MTDDANALLNELAEELAHAKRVLEDAMDVEKNARAECEAVEAKLFDVLENVGIKSFRTDRGLFSRNELAWAQVTDEAAARQWAETDMPELLLLNRQRLSSLVRDILEEGKPMPPGVDFTTSRKIKWTSR